MKKTFFKNLFRDIKNTLSRFLSIVIIIAVGVAFYAGVRATSPDMKISGDYYFNKNNLMDFKLISTLGLTKDDISEVQKIKGVTKVEGSYSIDAVIEKDKHSLVLNINSLSDENGINKIKIVDGRRAENNNEAVVEQKFLKENKLKIGDKILLKSGNDSKIEDNLKNNEFKIVGSAESPLYVSAQRQLSSVGNGSVKGFVYILPDVFKADVYTEVYVRTGSDESKNSLLENENYKKVTDKISENLKVLGVSRGEIRYADVIKTAQDKINEAENKLNSSKKEAADKFADGYMQLADARKKLNTGKTELQKNETIITDGEKQLVDGKKKLDDSEIKLNSGKQQAAYNISLAIEEKVIEAKKQVENDPENQMFLAQYNSLNQIYENDIKGKDFDDIYNSLKNDGTLEQMNSFFDIKALKNNFDQSAIAISLGRQQLADKEKLLQGGKVQLNDARQKLEAGQKELDENTEKLKAQEVKVNAQLNDAGIEIQSNKDKINDIKKPDFYVLGRSANVGYETYRQDSDRIDNIGKVFPLIFFLVAALVSLTTMTRMVQENRVEIGTFKALGYSTASIVAHYLIYALGASIIGSILGVSCGYRLFPPLIMNAYSSLYTIPDSLTPFNSGIAMQASLIVILFTTVATAVATLEELRETPASLMRPKPPKSGKTILLERATFIWKRLSFTKKVTARNIFRYKQRLFMTVIGIAACTGLMITGFGLKGAIVGAAENQFSKIYKYDMQTTLTKSISYDGNNEIKDKILNDSNIKSILFTYSKNSSVKEDSNGSQDAYVVIPEKKEEINKYINLSMNGRELKLDDDGVIITEKLSKLINKKIGDTIEITVNDKVLKVKISSITEHYVQHYIYISPEYYKKLTGEKPELNAFYGLLKNTSESSENDTSKILTKISGINSISFKNNTNIDFNKSIKSINSVVLVLIVSAAVLAFVVIYNLTNININERQRELATIKLLGFYNKELALYIYRENMILTIIGSLTGIAVGILLTRFVITSAETNVMMFLKTINPIYFLYSIILTIFFSVVVNLAMYRRFNKVDMIKSLKSAE